MPSFANSPPPPPFPISFLNVEGRKSAGRRCKDIRSFHFQMTSIPAAKPTQRYNLDNKFSLPGRRIFLGNIDGETKSLWQDPRGSPHRGPTNLDSQIKIMVYSKKLYEIKRHSNTLKGKGISTRQAEEDWFVGLRVLGTADHSGYHLFPLWGKENTRDQPGAGAEHPQFQKGTARTRCH